MISKTIHYCWFGRNPLPKSAQKCITSWRKFFPDYEIKEWNEDNFDVNIIPYTQQAYEAKKYAFVSDYARFWVLYHYGGVYFDTDVEVIKPLDDIINKGPFMGFEIDGTKKGEKIAVNPGLGISAERGMSLYKEFLDGYKDVPFLLKNGAINPFGMIPMITKLFKEKGLQPNGQIQTIDRITIYPQEFFNPFHDATGKLLITENTRTIHWYSKTWLPPEPQWRITVKRYIRRYFGKNFLYRLKTNK